jgi:ribonuclease P/MRP protein subunit POP1
VQSKNPKRQLGSQRRSQLDNYLSECIHLLFLLFGQNCFDYQNYNVQLFIYKICGSKSEVLISPVLGLLKLCLVSCTHTSSLEMIKRLMVRSSSHWRESQMQRLCHQAPYLRSQSLILDSNTHPRLSHFPKVQTKKPTFRSFKLYHLGQQMQQPPLHPCSITRMPSQKAINRRKSQTRPGSYPAILFTDAAIPVILLTSRLTSPASAQGTWTLLAPWKCILPIWYGLLHYPLSSGGNPRFGGLNEIRQLHFEHGVPWFPADFPGTNAGFAWEQEQRLKKRADWTKRPKGKRTEWDSLDLGAGRKGEFGQGWACDFEKLLFPSSNNEDTSAEMTQDTPSIPGENKIAPNLPIRHFPSKAFTSLLSSSDAELPPSSAVAAVLITLTSRGVATPCARIYRLPAPSTEPTQPKGSLLAPQKGGKKPSAMSIREQWLPLIPSAIKSKPPPGRKSKTAKEFTREDLSAPMPQRIRLLAQSLLDTPPLPYPADKSDDGHPLVPDEEDLIGFVTTGEFNLAEGKGVAIGTVLVDRAVKGLRRENKQDVKGGRWCVVRNAGEKIGRLARWDTV